MRRSCVDSKLLLLLLQGVSEVESLREEPKRGVQGLESSEFDVGRGGGLLVRVFRED